MRAVVVAALVAACGGRTPTPAPTSPPVDPQVAKVLAGVDEALAARPNDQVLVLLRAAYSEAAGRNDEALEFLARLDKSGWDVPFTPVDFTKLANEPRFREIATRIAARAPNVQRSELAFTFAPADFIPEGIAVDASTGTFYVGSIRKRTIVAITRDGRSRTFVSDGLLAVLGLKVDASRGVLWAASWASDAMEGSQPTDTGRAEVTAFSLADGTLRRRIAFAAGTDPHLLNDIAIATDGTLYVTDSEAGAVWRVPADRDVFEPVVPPATFAYPNGIVLATPERLLVAHGTGIAAVEVASGNVTRFDNAPGIPLGGIDGLVLDGRTLYAVQNGLGVPRLVAIELDEAATRATKLTVLENRMLDLPTTCALFNGALYTIANAQLDAIGPGGVLRKDKTLRDPNVLRTPL